jgi:tetratricopeptide (TPR) repeat protein
MDTTPASHSIKSAACTLHDLFGTAIAALLLVLSACERSGPVSDAGAAREADYQRARQLCEQHDFAGAASFYERALSVNPDFADGHMELGLLYENQLADPISAIYHYRRFLELRPDSEKRPLVEDFIERARLSFAAKSPQAPLVDPSELTRLENEKAGLLQENAALRARVAELEKAANATQPVATTPTTVTDAPGVPPRPASAPAPAPGIVLAAAPVIPVSETSITESPRLRTYIVQRGDTLQSLALRYYGSRAGWEKIFQANRSGLASKDQLKVGQQLVIP